MQVGRILEELATLTGTSNGLISIADVRWLLDGFAAPLNEDLPEIGAFYGSIPYKMTPEQSLTLDVMRPAGQGPFPVLVYLHGGAWVWGSPATHRKLTFRLAQQGFLVFSVDYRLAPEHPFPAGFHDCIDAVNFAKKEAASWGGNCSKIVLAGDSAGVNGAAATAIELSNRAEAPSISAVGLLYGVFDFSGIDADPMSAMLADAYLGQSKHELIEDPRVSPIKRAADLPPAHIAIGTADPLIEDAETLRAALARAGKVHDYRVYSDMPHAFAQMEFLQDSRCAIRRMSDFLHRCLR